MEEKQRDVLIDHINKLVSGIGFVRELIEKMESEEPELRPCPFCGGEAELYEKPGYSIRCSLCVAETNWYFNEIEAIEAWNRRV